MGNITDKKKYTLKKNITNIGRSRRNDIVIKNSKISNHHAQIVYSDGIFYIRDLKSTNGTYLDDERIRQERELKNGSILSFGRFKFTLKMGVEDVTVFDEDFFEMAETIPRSAVKGDLLSEKILKYIIKNMLIKKIPVVGFNEWFAQNGAILAFSLDYEAIGKQTAELAQGILEAQVPIGQFIQEPQQVSTIVNLKVAQKLAITVSEDLLMQMGEVIK